MKVTDKIKKAQEEGRAYWSFEYFPPKTEMVWGKFYQSLLCMNYST